MKTVGIIAEFNPFHNGHRYIIEEAKRITGAGHCVIVMSGSFTQRGEPACMYKYDRVRSALLCGADAVFELPVSYATATAETFAYGGVSILNSLGCVDHLAFGAECADIDRLRMVADELLDPTESYRTSLEHGLASGLSYPAARAAALPAYSDILSSPNNILAIEYLKALSRLNSDITPCAIARIGSGYHDTGASEYASAEAIRQLLISEADIDIRESVPEPVFDIMSTEIGQTIPITYDDMTQYAEYMLRTARIDELASYQDMNEDIARRFLKTDMTSTLTDHLGALKTKEMTYTRLSRAMLHCILRLRDMTRSDDGKLLAAPYTRLLGFNRSSGLMHEISANAGIPVITKAADAADILSPEAYELHESTLNADRIYDMIVKNKYGTRLTDGCRISPVII